MSKFRTFLSAVLVTLFAASGAFAQGFYAISNKADGNTVVAFKVNGSGKYEVLGEFATGGTGTGDLEIPALKKDPTHPLANGDDPLISANAIATASEGKHILAVNPGNATISLMGVNDDGTLKSLSTAPSSDKFPISLAVRGGMVVAASVGDNNGSGSISAFRIDGDDLEAVEGSRRDLKARPSTISFSSDGEFVIVNELVTGKIHSFAVKDGSLSEAPVSTVNSPRDEESRFQAIPVGFAVHGDKILMSEARFLTPDFKLREEANVVVQSPLYSWQTSSVSSYSLGADGSISMVSGDVLTGDAVEGGEIANCWVAVSADGKTLWAANALSSSISTFRVRKNGSVSLINARAYKDKSERLFFSDLAISKDGSELYQLVGNKGEIMIFEIKPNGDLEPKQTVGGLPELGAYGLVAF
ncbi:MAG: beta-propeller fold lactonase family protein [Ahrensia sp.]|nr:beta-propeller fold lactonase family protein [Ahrensia sp.]